MDSCLSLVFECTDNEPRFYQSVIVFHEHTLDDDKALAELCRSHAAKISNNILDDVTVPIPVDFNFDNIGSLVNEHMPENTNELYITIGDDYDKEPLLTVNIDEETGDVVYDDLFAVLQKLLDLPEAKLLIVHHFIFSFDYDYNFEQAVDRVLTAETLVFTELYEFFTEFNLDEVHISLLNVYSLEDLFDAHMDFIHNTFNIKEVIYLDESDTLCLLK